MASDQDNIRQNHRGKNLRRLKLPRQSGTLSGPRKSLFARAKGVLIFALPLFVIIAGISGFMVMGAFKSKT